MCLLTADRVHQFPNDVAQTFLTAAARVFCSLCASYEAAFADAATAAAAFPDAFFTVCAANGDVFDENADLMT